MFETIMVPIDLAHRETLSRSLECAGDLAKLYGAEVVYVGVTSNVPSSVAHSAKEYGKHLTEFAEDQAKSYGIKARSLAALANDPAAHIDDALMAAVKGTGADLVVMQSHVPNVIDYVWPSNGGKIAEHARCSVMVVRDTVEK